MKKKLLSALLLIVSLITIVSAISACSCSDDTPDTTPDSSASSTPDSAPSGNNGTNDSNSGSGGTEASKPNGGTGDSNTGTGGGTTDSTPDTDDPGEVIPPIPDLPENTVYPTGFSAPVVKYLRIAEIGANTVTVKFNAIGKYLVYDVRYSTQEITESNFESATKVSGIKITSDGEVKTATLNLTVNDSSKYYIAVQAKSNNVPSTIETVRAGGIEPVFVDPDRITSVYCGEVIKDLTPLIDEFEGIVDPLNGNPGRLPTNRLSQFYYKAGDMLPGMLDPYKETHERYGTNLAPIIDLEYVHYVDCIMVFYSHDTYDLTVRSSKDFANFNTPEDWDATNVTYTADQLTANAWNKIEIGKDVRFIQLEFLDGTAPVEVLVYGYQKCETVGDEIGDTTHDLPSIGELMGICGLLGDGAGYCTVEQLQCATVLREYHNLGWAYNWSSFPKKSATFTKTNLGNFDAKYELHSKYNLIVPCLQWSEGDNPARTYNKLTGKLNSEVASFTEKYLPDTYIAYADVVYQLAARYGSSKMGYLYETVRAHSDGGDQIGLNYIKWIECGNEPNGEDQRGTTPYQLAALTSASYDGHMRTVLSDVYNPDDFSYFLGAKNADPDIKIAMAGLAGIGDRYIASMCYWMRANRSDIRGNWTSKNDAIAMDAFNVHTYFGEVYYLNGQEVIVGVSPEEYGLVDAMSSLIEFRDKYYPGVEIWLTEFGWDTNESYETMTSAHAYGEYTSREVQAMWLTRAYLLLSSCGVDKATMYMLEDTAYANDRTAIGKYGTCGVYGYEFTEDNQLIYRDASGNAAVEGTYMVWDEEKQENVETKGYLYLDTGAPCTASVSVVPVPKESYYYMCTLLNTLREFTFKRELKTGNDKVWVYQYANDDKDEAYAVWCPTSNMTKVEGYRLYVGTEYESVTLTETDTENKSITGKSTTLTVDSEGYVSINVSENPVYVVVNK